MKYSIFFLIYFLLRFTAYTQPGSFDNTFGTAGKVIGQGYTGECFAVAIQSDGKIVCGGAGTPDTSNSFLLVRYSTTGSIDAGFGTSGKVVTRFPGSYEEINALNIQTNGKIVAAGWTSYQNDSGVYRADVALTRYNSTGTLDNTFGLNGIVTTSIYGSKNYVTCMAIQSDGKIVVAGNRNNDENDDTTAFIFRYTSNGVLDTGFHSNGILIEAFDHPVKINSIAIQTDGKIVIGGMYRFDLQNAFFAVRYLTNGSKDVSGFGSNGKAIMQMGNGITNSALNNIALQSDGKILAAGFNETNSSTQNLALVRFKTNGTADSTFGQNGKVAISFSQINRVLSSVLVQADGKIIAGGYSNDFGFSYSHFTLCRFKNNGNLDSTFGTNGIQSSTVGALNASSSSVLQSDGKIILAGSGGSENTFVIARYNGGNAPFAVVKTKNSIIDKNQNIKIYPNPANTSLTIDGLSNNKISTILIVDLQGKLLQKFTVKEVSFSININTLNAGTYFINIKDDDGSIIKKFVKQ